MPQSPLSASKQPSANTPSKPTLSVKPTLGAHFDAWNSSSTGHQRAENRLAGSTSWRNSRSMKLGVQFSSGAGGGQRIADTVGAGSEGFGSDGRTENGGWVRGASGLRGRGQMSLIEAFGVKKGGIAREVRKENDRADTTIAPLHNDNDSNDMIYLEGEERPNHASATTDSITTTTTNPPSNPIPQIFKNLTIYINGSTAPTISDHKLKSLLVSHGARISIALGRRTVTHVILGRPNANNNSNTISATESGSGGGLAATKIQKEIASKVGNNSVRFVTVEWVMESVRLGKRAAESRFEALRLAPKKTGDLVGMFSRKAKS
ncbi:hypothetical protein AAFC00_001055 [Neodothiora populina]|uniref:BRCT domain-containing protein n=1 Tax=Neodothiora populina TaxID=2781224 RepID=A0ABR3PMP2_9PEZI